MSSTRVNAMGVGRRVPAVLAGTIALLAAGCGDDGNESGSDAGTTTGLDDAAITETVEEMMDELHVPGAVVLVRQGDDEYLEAFGTRTLDGEDVTVEDHFRVGSNTKTWTGTVLLQLVDEGLLSMDDPISEYFPEVPNGENITVGQILDMRSGLFSYTDLLEVNETMDDEPGTAWDPEVLVALGLAEDPYFAPGEGYTYSNTNLVLAGLLIEQLTGNPVEEEFATRIFEPLGMEGSSLPARDDASLPEPHANGYLFGTNVGTIEDLALSPDEQAQVEAGDLLPNDVTDLNPSWAWTAGGGTSTASDLADYVEALVGGGLLSDELQQERLDSIEPTNPDNPQAAGYGWALATFGPMIGHDGSMPGYQSFMTYEPEQDLTIIVLTNLQSAPDGSQPANEISRALMGQLLSQPGSDDDPTEPL